MIAIFEGALENPNIFFSPTLLLTNWSARLTGGAPQITPLLCIWTAVFIFTAIITFKVHQWKPSQLCIICRTTFLNEKIVERLRHNVGEYIPPWWYNRHLGAIVPFGFDAKLKYERELFFVEDACFAVDWYPCNPQHILRGESPLKICVFYPGLGLGSTNVSETQTVRLVEHTVCFIKACDIGSFFLRRNSLNSL
jgi:hypothetical protein